MNSLKIMMISRFIIQSDFVVLLYDVTNFH